MELKKNELRIYYTLENKPFYFDTALDRALEAVLEEFGYERVAGGSVHGTRKLAYTKIGPAQADKPSDS